MRYHISWRRFAVSALNMYQNGKKAQKEALIKFVAPIDLKANLLDDAHERYINRSTLLKLITSEHIKRMKQTY
jgi:hypothetical protein